MSGLTAEQIEKMKQEEPEKYARLLRSAEMHRAWTERENRNARATWRTVQLMPMPPGWRAAWSKTDHHPIVAVMLQEDVEDPSMTRSVACVCDPSGELVPVDSQILWSPRRNYEADVLAPGQEWEE
jgi:hypothetical protein